MFVFEEISAFFFQVPAGAVEKVLKKMTIDEIKIYKKIVMIFFVKFGVVTPSELKAYASA